MANLGFVLKEAVMSATETMTDAEFRKIITALFNYAVYNEEPDFDKGEVLCRAIYQMEKPSIDANNEKWEARARQYSASKETGHNNLAKEILNRYPYSNNNTESFPF